MQIRILSLFTAFVFLATALPADAAPKADLWPRWAAHDTASTTVIDHAAWGRFLGRYMVLGEAGPNRVAYAKVSAADRKSLEGYLQSLAGTAVSRLNRNEQFAYWVNFYNALTIKLILDHQPVKSILDIDISPGFFAVGPWGKKLVTVEGEKISLDDIEHRILRPIWKDPRVHYAVNCASIGCPNLQPTPFTGATVEKMLDAAARGFVNGTRSVWFDGKEVGVSSIYKWFSQDFGRNDREIIQHIRKYAAPDLARQLASIESISFYNYDWLLNRAP